MSPFYARVFVDAEFSNLTDMHLISLALVSEKGDQFYAELSDYPKDSCNAFVCTTVLPLLGRSAGAVMSREQIQVNLMKWLEKVQGVCDAVVASFDFVGDYAALVESLGDEPAWLRADNVSGRIDETVRKEFFQLTGLPQHHALHDALALRYAYRPPSD
jgi:hypothetical protein